MNLDGSTIDWPFRVDDRGSFVVTSDKKTIIEQAIMFIIETTRGEYEVMLDLGIENFVFETQDAGFGERLEYHLDQQVRKYVPGVTSIKRVGTSTDENGTPIIEIEYTTDDQVNTPKSLTFPLWRLNDAAVA